MATADTPELRAVTSSGKAIARTSIVYMLGSVVAVPVGIVSLALTTHFLLPAEYGQLATLFAFAGTLTLLIGLGSLQGTLMAVFGSAGDGGGDDAPDEVGSGEDPLVPVREGRRVMGSGLLITLACALVAGLGATLLAGPLDGALLHTDDLVAVRLAVLSACAGAVWRLVQQVFRLERRAVAFSVVSTARPLIVIGLTALVLVQGWGVRGVLGATAAGTAMASLVAVGAARKNFQFAPRWSDVGDIYRRGRRFIPLVGVTWGRSYLDVLLLTQVVSSAGVGYYQLASRIGQLPVYLSSAFLMAWPPMERSPIFRAVIKQRGHPAFAGLLYGYLMLLTLGMFVVLAVGADIAIRIAQPQFSPAAALIPVTAAASAAHIAFYGLFRACRFPWRRAAYTVLALVGMVIYAGLAAVLVPSLGIYALPICAGVSSLFGVAGMLLLDWRFGERIRLSYGRLAGAIGLAGGLVGVASYAVPTGPARNLAELGAIGLYPLALVATGIVPRSRVRALVGIARHALPGHAGSHRLLRRWELLNPREQDAVRLLVAEKRSIREAAELLDTSPSLVVARMVRGLRQLADLPRPTPHDSEAGIYLLSRDPTLERDQIALALTKERGASLADLHELDVAHQALRHLPRRRWRRVNRRGRSGLGAHQPAMLASAARPTRSPSAPTRRR